MCNDNFDPQTLDHPCNIKSDFFGMLWDQQSYKLIKKILYLNLKLLPYLFTYLHSGLKYKQKGWFLGKSGCCI